MVKTIGETEIGDCGVSGSVEAERGALDALQCETAQCVEQLRKVTRRIVHEAATCNPVTIREQRTVIGRTIAELRDLGLTVPPELEGVMTGLDVLEERFKQVLSIGAPLRVAVAEAAGALQVLVPTVGVAGVARPYGRRPLGIELDGQRYELRTWSDLLVVLADVLSAAHPETFVEQAKRVRLRGRVCFTTEAFRLLRSRAVLNGELYVETVTHPSHAVAAARDLVYLFGYTGDRFRIDEAD